MPPREFRLPDLGEGLEDAEIASWRVAAGERVELNQTLVEVNTAKALVEIPSPWEGVIERLHAAEGDVVKVGEPLLSIAVAEAEDASEASKPKRRPVLVGYGVAEDEAPADAKPAPARDDERARRPVRASPPVRRLAKDLGVDLPSVTPTGPHGRVTREDVENAAKSNRPVGVGSPGPEGTAVAISQGEAQLIPVRGTRRMIAEHMTRSAREIPHVTTFLTADAFWLEAFREELQRDTGEKVRPLPIVVRALVEVCKQHPKLNSSYSEQRSAIALYRDCHVGIATDTEHGLLVPVVEHAEQLGILELSREIARLTEAARAGKAKPGELMGSTMTVTNVGTFGAEFGTPIINHPEAAILALGVIEPRALVVDGNVEARPAVTLSLSFDHRVLDGAEAGRALKALAELLESPFKLGALPR